MCLLVASWTETVIFPWDSEMNILTVPESWWIWLVNFIDSFKCLEFFRFAASVWTPFFPAFCWWIRTSSAHQWRWTDPLWRRIAGLAALKKDRKNAGFSPPLSLRLLKITPLRWNRSCISRGRESHPFLTKYTWQMASVYYKVSWCSLRFTFLSNNTA